MAVGPPYDTGNSVDMSATLRLVGCWEWACVWSIMWRSTSTFQRNLTRSSTPHSQSLTPRPPPLHCSAAVCRYRLQYGTHSAGIDVCRRKKKRPGVHWLAPSQRPRRCPQAPWGPLLHAAVPFFFLTEMSRLEMGCAQFESSSISIEASE